MIRKPTTLLFSLLCAGLFCFAAAPAASAASGTPTDEEILRYLTPAQVAQWNDAAKKIKDGDAEIAAGQKLLAEQPDPNSSLQLNDIPADHAKGTAMVREGTLAKGQATRAQTALRRTAQALMENAKSDAKDTAAANYTVATAQWPGAVQTLSADIYKALNAKGYRQVYLAGVFAFDKSKYTLNPALTADVMKQLTQLDADGHVLASNVDPGFKLAQSGGKLVVNYSGGPAAKSGDSAAVVGEVVFDIMSGYAAVSLRAVDLSNLRIVANETMLLSIEPSLGKKLGVVAFRVPSKPLPPVTDSKAAKPVLTVNLQDPNGYLSLAKRIKGSFGVATMGNADTMENRFAILMLKSYFLDQQKDLNISDVDFLTMSLTAESPATLALLPADVAGAWELPNLPSLSDSMTLKPLMARDLGNGSAETEVGTVTITRDLPKLSPPSPAEMRAGGY